MNGTICDHLEERKLTNLNQTGNTTACKHDSEVDYEQSNAAFAVVLFSISAWIIITNAVVVICFAAIKSLQKNRINLHILSLSVTDVLVGLSSILMTMSYLKPSFFTSYYKCASVFAFYVAAQTASLYHILGICLHRFIITVCYLKHPNPNHGITKRNTMLQVGGVWIVALIFAIIPFASFGKWDSKLHSCSLNTLLLDKYKISLSFWDILSLVPQIIINIMYLTIYCKLRRACVKVTAAPTSISNSSQHSTLPIAKLNQTIKTANNVNIKHVKETGLNILHAQSGGQKRFHNLANPKQEHTNTEGHHIRNDATNLSPENNRSHILKEDINLPSCSKNVLTVKTRTEAETTKEKHHVKGKLINGTEESEGKSEKTRNMNESVGPSHNNSDDRSNNNGKHLKLLVTVGIVLLAMNICLTPITMLFVLETIHEGFVRREIKSCIVMFSLLNSAINPVIYAFRIKQLKESFINGLARMRTFYLR